MLKGLDEHLTTEPANPIGEAAREICEMATWQDIVEELGEEVVVGNENQDLIEQLFGLEELLKKYIIGGKLDTKTFVGEGVAKLAHLVAVAAETCTQRKHIIDKYEEAIMERETEEYYFGGN